MNVSVISHMCAGTQKRFNKKTIQKLESMRFYRISKEFRQNMLLIKKKIYVNYWKLRKDTTISILKYFCVCFVDYELEKYVDSILIM